MTANNFIKQKIMTMDTDPRIEEARRLLWEVTSERREKAKEDEGNKVCKCGHKRKDHSISHNINYTGGMCRKCECKNFLEISK